MLDIFDKHKMVKCVFISTRSGSFISRKFPLASDNKFIFAESVPLRGLQQDAVY